MLKFYKDISFLFFKIFFFLLCVSVMVPEKDIEAPRAGVNSQLWAAG